MSSSSRLSAVGFTGALFASIQLACSEPRSEPGHGGGAPSASGATNASAAAGQGGVGAAGGEPAGSGVGGAAGAGMGGDLGSSCTGAEHEPGGPDAWGGCWPGPTNTGVPEGTELAPYTGPCTIQVDDTVIDAQVVDCELIIEAKNVRITRSKINGSVATAEDSSGYSFSISDSEVDVGDRAGTGIGAVNFTATRVHVRGGNRSIHCWNDCVVTDSYTHGQFTDPSGTYHESAMRMGQSATFRHNTVICDAPDVPPDGGCSADLTGYGDFGPVQNNTIERNLFGATTGGYCTYGGSSQGKPFSDETNHIVFIGNVWQRGDRPSDHGERVCGYYGSNTAFDPSLPGNVWKDNQFDDGAPVPSSN